MSGRKPEIRRKFLVKKLRSAKDRTSRKSRRSQPPDGDSTSAQNEGERKEPNVVKVKPAVRIPQWNSDAVNHKARLTTSMRVGIFNHGCKSKFVSLHKFKPMSEEMQAREASDLQRILSLANPPKGPSHPSLSPLTFDTQNEEEEEAPNNVDGEDDETSPYESVRNSSLTHKSKSNICEQISASTITVNLLEGKRTVKSPKVGCPSLVVLDFKTISQLMEREIRMQQKNISGYLQQKGRHLRYIFNQKRSSELSTGDSGISRRTNSAPNSVSSATKGTHSQESTASSSALSGQTSDPRWSSLPTHGGKEFGVTSSAVGQAANKTGAFLWMDEQNPSEKSNLLRPLGNCERSFSKPITSGIADKHEDSLFKATCRKPLHPQNFQSVESFSTASRNDPWIEGKQLFSEKKCAISRQPVQLSPSTSSLSHSGCANLGISGTVTNTDRLSTESTSGIQESKFFFCEPLSSEVRISESRVLSTEKGRPLQTSECRVQSTQHKFSSQLTGQVQQEQCFLRLHEQMVRGEGGLSTVGLSPSSSLSGSSVSGFERLSSLESIACPVSSQAATISSISLAIRETENVLRCNIF